jgi:hypothetical protein
MCMYILLIFLYSMTSMFCAWPSAVGVALIACILQGEDHDAHC